MREEVVVIVGAGQSGLATAACLTALSVPCLILERDDCVASLWRRRSYERVTLHLAKRFSQLPHAPLPDSAPNFLPKPLYLRYLDDYAARFGLRVALRREVVAAEYDPAEGRWRIEVRRRGNGGGGAAAAEEEEEEEECYWARYLVVASGENDEAVVPGSILGMESFPGPVVHSSRYRNGREYEGKAVLVVGAGNSGMEVALDVADCGARSTTIVVRSRLHVVSREIWWFAMLIMRFLPLGLLDALILLLCYLKFGDLSKYGIHRPSKGPLYLKKYTPKYPVVDSGTVKKIKSGEIQVMPSIKSIKGNYVTFSNGRIQSYDAIILATGYRSTVKKWLKSDDSLVGEDGMVKRMFPNNWKGDNRLYCAGLARRGIYGSGEDAQSIANDIACDYHHYHH
ncbi:probable indole-3-pyruvate monooxygenase YUCCA10 [Zingiber officinale]|uniref:probable indole-3-pyruvate monooxygenase YUCCA10 n=1 Tax=Zingiber officinale TaxID=94328 RepID=UPI001C4D76E5|nr:probable indole-3-pyruvate monooxygenase YUCCA10 [Zingiber officinale]